MMIQASAFLEFVMGQYINEGVGELGSNKLPDLIQLRYGAIHDGVKELGEVPTIRSSFIGFQKYLYESQQVIK